MNNPQTTKAWGIRDARTTRIQKITYPNRQAADDMCWDINYSKPTGRYEVVRVIIKEYKSYG